MSKKETYILEGIRLGLTLLSKEEKHTILFLSLLVAFFSFFEIIALMSLMPLISIITGGESIKFLNVYSNIIEMMNLPIDLKNIQEHQLTLYIACISMSLLVLSSFSNILSHFLILRFVAKSATRLADDMMKLIFNTNMYWFADKNASILTRIFFGDIMLWGNDFIQKMITILQKISLLFFSAFILVNAFPASGLVGFIIISILAILLIYAVKPKLKLWGSYVKEKSDQLVKICDTCFNGIMDIFLTSSSLYFKNKYVQNFASFANVKYKSDILNLLPSISLMLIGQVGLVAITTYLVINNRPPEEITSSIAILILISSRIIPAVNRLSGDITGFIRSFAFISRLIELRINLEKSQIHNEHSQEKKPFKKWKNLIISNIQFSYSENQNPILKNISFKFLKNQLYVLTGVSGSGKTTFINVLMGLLRPNDGKIFIDDREIHDEDRILWFKEIGLVPQNPFLLDGTLLENIAFGIKKQNINIQKVKKIIKLTKLDELTKQLPNNIYGNIGENGKNISGGQRQRIAIARALYRNASVIIFDEATNSLDNKTKFEVLKIIKNLSLNKIIIMISHDDDVIKFCDTTILMDRGRIKSK